MTPGQARQHARRLNEQLLMAEAAGWRFVTIDGITTESEAGLQLYEQVLYAFEDAAGRERRYASTCSRLTFGIRSDDAGQCIALLRARLAELNPPGARGGHRWDIRGGTR